MIGQRTEAPDRDRTEFGRAIPVADRENGELEVERFSDARQVILEIGTRHPLRQDQAAAIESTLGDSETIDRMVLEKELTQIKHGDTVYLLPGCFLRGKASKADKGGQDDESHKRERG